MTGPSIPASTAFDRAVGQQAGRDGIELADVAEANSRRNDPSVEGAYGRSNRVPIAPCRNRAMSVDAVRTGDHARDQRAHFRPGVGALIGRHAQVLSANAARPHCWARRPIGTSPAHDTRLGSSKMPTLRADYEIVASTRCPSLWPNLILEKSHSSTTTGHFAVTTHPRPIPHRCIKA